MELIRDSQGNLKFLTWDGNRSNIVDEFTHENVTYSTSHIDASVGDFLALPSGLAPFGTVRELFNRVASLIRSAVGGDHSSSVALSFLVFATWFPESAPVAPFLWIVVPSAYSTAALKQVLRLTCRHALVVNALPENWPASVPLTLQPTLIAEVDSPSPRLLNVLRASQTHGIQFVRGGRAVDLYCPKVIFARQPAKDSEAAGFPLEIVLNATDGFVSPLDYGRASPVAQEFQNQLIGYRFSNFSKICAPSLDLGCLSVPVRAMAHSLAGAIVGDDDLQAQILPFLQQLNADIQNGNVATITETILEVILARSEQQELGVTEITGDLNTLILGRGVANNYRPKPWAGN
jgi:hypothetical protein